jgi:hypothetical protein
MSLSSTSINIDIEPYLELFVKQGFGLIAIDTNSGVSDPKLKAYFKGKKQETIKKTQHLEKTINPKWSEVLILHPLVDENRISKEILVLEVYNAVNVLGSFVSKEFMGRAEIEIEDLEMNEKVEKVIKLQDVESGEVSIELIAKNFGVEKNKKDIFLDEMFNINGCCIAILDSNSNFIGVENGNFVVSKKKEYTNDNKFYVYKGKKERFVIETFNGAYITSGLKTRYDCIIISII